MELIHMDKISEVLNFLLDLKALYIDRQYSSLILENTLLSLLPIKKHRLPPIQTTYF